MKKLLFIVGGSLLLLVCIGFGAVFAAPLLASAKTATTPAATPTANTAQQDQYCQQFQQDLAKRLNVSVDTLNQARQGAYEDVLAQLVKDGKLTQAQADKIKQRIESNKACRGFHAKHLENNVRHHFLREHRQDLINLLATDLKLTPDQLTSQLKDGKTLNQIAKAQGVTTAQLKTDIINAVNTILDKAGSTGDLTQSQVSTFKQFFQKHPGVLDRLVNHSFKKTDKK